jgi:hypothetical protein
MIKNYMQDISASSRSLFFRRFLRSAFTVGLLFGCVSLLANRAFPQTPGAPPRPVKRLRGRVILTTFPVAPSGNLRYELSLAPCARSECPFQVRLIDGDQVQGTLSLDWASIPERPDKMTIDESLGAGDPLQKEWKGLAWQTGVEGQNVAITARSIALTPQLNGLLVDQRVGFEHLKRQHYLFVAIGRKLARAWTGIEELGPTWSMVETTEPLPEGSQLFIYFNIFGYYRTTGSEADRVEFEIYRWNSQKNVIESVPATDGSSPVVALVAGAYDTVDDAWKALQQNSDCLKDFLIVNADSLPQSFKGKVAIAALSAKTPLAERVIEEIRQCAPTMNIQLLTFSPRR